jgi:hypothetical protein
MMQDYKIVFENSAGDTVAELEFGNIRKAREVFEALVLRDFARAILVEDSAVLSSKVRA